MAAAAIQQKPTNTLPQIVGKLELRDGGTFDIRKGHTPEGTPVYAIWHPRADQLSDEEISKRQADWRHAEFRSDLCHGYIRVNTGAFKDFWKDKTVATLPKSYADQKVARVFGPRIVSYLQNIGLELALLTIAQKHSIKEGCEGRVIVEAEEAGGGESIPCYQQAGFKQFDTSKWPYMPALCLPPEAVGDFSSLRALVQQLTFNGEQIIAPPAVVKAAAAEQKQVQ
jgi:hypothetical protein